MEFAGIIDSEETFAGSLEDGRTIYVEMSAFCSVPESQAFNPQYWLKRLNNGDFDSEDKPLVWME